MKRKVIFIVSAAAFLILLFYLAGSIAIGYPLFSKNRSKYYIKELVTGREGEPLPNIRLLLPDSTTIMNLASIHTGQPIVLFYFGPYCPYCQLEMLEIIANMKKLESIQFYLISPYALSDIKKFHDTYDLGRYSNVIVGMDFEFKFGEYYRTQNIPYLAIYSNDGKLKSAFNTGVKYDQIKSVVED